MANSYGISVGDKIRLTIEGEVSSVAPSNYVTFENAAGSYDVSKFQLIILEKAFKKPDHWPPQLGDVWRVNRTDWHVVQNDNSYPTTVTPSASSIMCPRSGVVMDFADFVKSYSYSAKLIYRAGDNGAY